MNVFEMLLGISLCVRFKSVAVPSNSILLKSLLTMLSDNFVQGVLFRHHQSIWSTKAIHFYFIYSSSLLSQVRSHHFRVWRISNNACWHSDWNEFLGDFTFVVALINSFVWPKLQEHSCEYSSLSKPSAEDAVNGVLQLRDTEVVWSWGTLRNVLSCLSSICIDLLLPSCDLSREVRIAVIWLQKHTLTLLDWLSRNAHLWRCQAIHVVALHRWHVKVRWKVWD